MVKPGDTLKENLEFLGITQKELAARTGLTEKHISQVISGKKKITTETAFKLEKALGISASFWNNLEARYQERLQAQEAKDPDEEEVKVYDEFKDAYMYLVDNAGLKKTRKRDERIIELQKFFGVASLRYVSDVEPAFFRTPQNADVDNSKLAAWMRIGELQARNIDLPEFEKKSLKEVLPELKRLSSQKNLEPIQNLLREAGVGLVFTPYMSNTSVFAVVRKINKKPVIQVSDKGKRWDTFWFNLFHEIGHIILHKLDEPYISFDDGNQENGTEKEADEFAQENLISNEDLSRLLDKGKFGHHDVEKFAEDLEIAPDIVLGRLVYEGAANWSQIAGKRRKFKIEEPQPSVKTF